MSKTHCYSFRILSAALLAAILISFAGPAVTFAQSMAGEVIVHYVEGTPLADGIGYDVKVYVSVFDSTGNSIPDLKAEQFNILEDSQYASIDSLRTASNEPINLILLLDTSASMNGTKMDAARNAAQAFVNGIDAEDQIAVLTFDNEVNRVLEFTNDRKRAADQLGNVDINPNGGTCMFDAAYQAAELASTLPPGRRAIILLSDGYDVITNDPCSVHTIDDVLKIAGEGSTRVPVHTIGLGNDVDEKSLKRISSLTGGIYREAGTSGELSNLFSEIANQFRSEYILHYTSNNAPGEHTVTVKTSGEQDTRTFLLPALPAQVSWAYPVDEQEIPFGEAKLTASVSERGEPVGSVRFEINGKLVGAVEQPPYEMEVDFSNYETTSLTLTVTALSPEGKELTSQTIQTRLYDPNKPTATPSAAAVETETTDEPAEELTFLEQYGLYLGIGLGLLILIIVIIVLTNKKKKTEYVEEDFSIFGDGATMDGINLASLTAAKLEVLASDDDSMVGKTFDVMGFPYRIGRSADNDMPFPKDSPVSRKHLVIDEDGEKITLREVITQSSDGKKKRPTYGTFINNEKIGENEIRTLQDGDEIQIGTRVKVRFIRPQPVEPEADGDATVDGLDISALQAQIDQQQPDQDSTEVDIDRTTEL